MRSNGIQLEQRSIRLLFKGVQLHRVTPAVHSNSPAIWLTHMALNKGDLKERNPKLEIVMDKRAMKLNTICKLIGHRSQE